MSEPEHPSALALESLAAGDPSPEAEAHVTTCAACTDYVEALRAEAKASSEAARPAFLADLESLATTPAEAPAAERIRDEESSDPERAEPPRADVPAAESEPRPAPGANEPRAIRSDEIQVEEIRVEKNVVPAANPPSRTAANVASLDNARQKRARAFNFAYTAIPLALVAAALFVLRPTGAPGPDGFPTAPSETAIRLKGPPVLAVVRDRQGNQERFTSNVAVAPDDRLRLELTVDREGTYEAGLLGEDGSWLVLLSPTLLTPGAHFSDKAAHLDDKPAPGWLVAGPPDEVARARATRDFTGLAILAVKVAPP